MIISETRVMRGPNMWHSEHKLIVVKLSFKDFYGVIPNRYARIVDLFPAAIAEPSKREDKLFSLALLFAAAGAQLQRNHRTLFATALPAANNCFFAVFEYEEEEAGRAAAKQVENMFIASFKGESALPFNEARAEIQNIIEDYYAGPSTSAIIEAARKRNIPMRQTDGGRFISFGHGVHQKRISAAICETTSAVGVDVAGDKDVTKELLSKAFIPVPEGTLIQKEESLNEVISELGFPLVVKPLNGNQGKRITTNINDAETLLHAFRQAKEYSNSVIIERYIEGNDYRFLVIGNKLVAAALRKPATLTGNGVDSIRQLVEKLNSDPKRGNGHEKVLTKVKIDERLERLLAKQQLTLDTVPESGRTVRLAHTANLSTGGSATDVTDIVHPVNKKLAERAAKVIGLDICGIDIMAPDVTRPFTENGGVILEVNAAPGLRMHISPSEGRSREVGDPIIDLMFAKGDEGRIPLVAVTGTNGKTTTTRLIAHIAQSAGRATGFTTTEGVYINEELVKSGDCSGPLSAEAVLSSPEVDFAVLECARGGIIRSGLAFDQCDVGIVTNVAEDHLGLKDIHTLEDLARVKAVVPGSVKPTGYAVLNAANDLSFNMRYNLTCNIALFALDPEHPRIRQHCGAGNIAATLDREGMILIRKGAGMLAVEQVKKIPITMEGKAGFMIENVLAATLGAYLSGIPIEHIREGLRSFEPSAEMTPGRINLFKLNGVNVIVDYAHNPHGLQALAGYLNNLETHKIGIITGVGDRRDEDIKDIGRIAARMYDEIVIRIDADTRGREPSQIANLIIRGIKEINSNIPHFFIPDPRDALKYAIEYAPKNSYVVISADKAIETVEMVKDLQQFYETAGEAAQH